MPKKKETRGRKKTLTARQYEKNQNKCKAEWKKENTRCINLRFNKESDHDILKKFDSVDNKANYVRELIREDIKEELGQS